MAPSLAEAPLGSRPLAVILSGGAALGSWQAGALYALSRRLSWHSVVGTSAGSLNAAAYAQDSMEGLRQTWRELPRREFLRLAPRLAPPSLYSASALRSFLARLIDEERCRRSRRAWLYVVAADLRGRRTLQAAYSPEPDGPWDGPLLDHVLGSIAIPFVFPPVSLDRGAGPDASAPEALLVDGHLTSWVDLRVVAQRGARDFLFLHVVEASRPRLGLRGFISSLVEQLLLAQIQNSLAALADLRPALGLRAFAFGPPRPLGVRIMAFDPTECRASFDQGERDAEELLRSPEDYLVE